MGMFSSGVINSDILTNVNIAPDGFAFGSATSIQVGERKEISISQKGRVRTDSIQRTPFDMLDTEIDFESYQNDFQTYYDYIIAAKQGLVNLQGTLPDQTVINYVKNTGSISAPAGTWLLGMLPGYVVGDVERSITVKLQGGGYRREWSYQNQNTAAATGGSGGAPFTGFAKAIYDMTRVAPPGIVAITNSSGDTIPLSTTATKLSLEPRAAPSPTSPRHQPILFGIDIKISVAANVFDLGEVNDALETYVNEDQDWTFHLAPCEHDISASLGDPFIVLHNSVFPNPSNMLKEHGGFLSGFELNGYIPLDTPAWAGNYFNMDIATNTLTLNRVI